MLVALGDLFQSGLADSRATRSPPALKSGVSGYERRLSASMKLTLRLRFVPWARQEQKQHCLPRVGGEFISRRPDMRMVQTCNRSRLPFKPLAQI
jgi:hypothetical protein